MRSIASFALKPSAASFEELSPAVSEPMVLEDSFEARCVQGLSPALEQMLDLQSISRAVGLERYGNRMFRAEHAGPLLADLHCARLRQRLVNERRRRGQELDRKSFNQDRVALGLVAQPMQFLVELVEHDQPAGGGQFPEDIQVAGRHRLGIEDEPSGSLTGRR